MKEAAGADTLSVCQPPGGAKWGRRKICLRVRVQKPSRIRNGSVSIPALKGKGSWQSENKECLELGWERCPNRSISEATFLVREGFPSKATVLPMGKRSLMQVSVLLQQGRISPSEVVTALLCCAFKKCYSPAPGRERCSPSPLSQQVTVPLCSCSETHCSGKKCDISAWLPSGEGKSFQYNPG